MKAPEVQGLFRHVGCVSTSSVTQFLLDLLARPNSLQTPDLPMCGPPCGPSRGPTWPIKNLAFPSKQTDLGMRNPRSQGVPCLEACLEAERPVVWGSPARTPRGSEGPGREVFLRQRNRSSPGSTVSAWASDGPFRHGVNPPVFAFHKSPAYRSHLKSHATKGKRPRESSTFHLIQKMGERTQNKNSSQATCAVRDHP